MEDKELYLWLATFKAAKRGEKTAQTTIRLEDERRAKEGLPSLQEEILAMLPKAVEDATPSTSTQPSTQTRERENLISEHPLTVEDINSSNASNAQKVI
ncbi:hypothetical protein [Xylanibacter brevis]|uniref:hypothetical protein n=1 Tax=Xylanibacter brevis TaxID=83231 RepID=UPI000486436D|nr:hypothetical protein [Xylanibacter brevis]